MRVAGVMLASVLVAGAAGGAAAQPAVDGYLSLGAGNSWYSTGYNDQSDWIAQGRGTIEFALPGNWGAQADVVQTHQSYGPPYFAAGAGFDTTDAAVHAFYRQPGQWLLGVIGQYRWGVYNNLGSGLATAQQFVGIEGQIYPGSFSLYGQVAYQHQSFLSFFEAGGWIARVRARYFIDPRWFVEASAQYSTLDSSTLTGDTVVSTMFGAATEYRFAVHPVSAFLAYSYDQDARGGSTGFIDNRVIAGFKWSFGAPSEWDRETGGASLDPFAPPFDPLLPTG